MVVVGRGGERVEGGIGGDELALRVVDGELFDLGVGRELARRVRDGGREWRGGGRLGWATAHHISFYYGSLDFHSLALGLCTGTVVEARVVAACGALLSCSRQASLQTSEKAHLITTPQQHSTERNKDESNKEEGGQNGRGSEDRLPRLQALLLEGGVCCRLID